MMKRILGIDYGDVRTGIAISDPLGITAGGVGTFRAYTDERLLEIILQKISEYGATKIVMGDPINMNGSSGERSRKAHRFADLLREASGLEVALIDERMTTMEAHRYLSATDTRGKKRKNAVDTLSAEIILQTYLDSPAGKKD